MRVWQPGSSLVSQRNVVGRGLVVGGDAAAPDRALPARAALPAADGARDRLAARRDRRLARAADPDRRAPSTTSATAARRARSGCSSALFVGASVVGIVCSYGQTYFTGWTGERMLADLRNHLFRHLQRLSLGFYERNRAGVLISRLTNDVEALDQLVTDGFTSLIQNTLTLVGAGVILFFLSWQLALATLIVHPAARRSATAIFRKKSSRSYRGVRETLGAVTATLAEDIAGMRVLQAFTRERAAREHFRAGRRGLPAPRTRRRSSRTRSTSRSSTCSRRSRPRSSSATAATSSSTGRRRSASSPRSSATRRTSSTRCSSSRSSTARSSRRSRRSTRSWRCSSRSRRSTDAPGAPELAARARPRALRRRPLRLRAPAPRCCTGSTSTSRPGRRSRSSATRAPASRRSPS